MPSGICIACWLMNHTVPTIKKKNVSLTKIHFTHLRFRVKIHAYIFKITNAIVTLVELFLVVFVYLQTSVVHFLFQVPQSTKELLLVMLEKDHSHFTDGKAEAEELAELSKGEVRLHSCFPWLPTPAAGRLLSLQLPSNDPSPLLPLFRSNGIFWLLDHSACLLWNYVFFPSQRNINMLWFCEERNTRADFTRQILLKYVEHHTMSVCFCHSWEWQATVIVTVLDSSKRKKLNSYRVCWLQVLCAPLLHLQPGLVGCSTSISPGPQISLISPSRTSMDLSHAVAICMGLDI